MYVERENPEGEIHCFKSVFQASESVVTHHYVFVIVWYRVRNSQS